MGICFNSNRAQDFWNEHSEWSQATFGTDQERGPLGALKHLEKEAKEAQAEVGAVVGSAIIGGNPKLREEIADCLFLTFDAARRSGMTLDTLLDEAFAKLKVNRKRVWQKPTSADQPIEHVRNEDDPPTLRDTGFDDPPSLR